MNNPESRASPAAQSEAQPRLIVLDDDPITRSMIARYFATESFLVQEAASASECRILLRQSTPDLIFVDIHLPDANGIAFAQEIRASSSVGLIFVTQRDCEIDRVVGLESAGDDYVIKPVNLRELMARSRALLRRRMLDRAPAGHCSVVTFGDYVMDMTRRELALRSGAQVQLTRGEFDLLAALVDAKGRALYRDFLAEVVSSRTEMGDARTVDSLIARLRRKLKQGGDLGDAIVTVTGIGYRFGLTVGTS
ncbi:response regulator transcription factor [Magnetospirillum sulfuroxidans]|uniref:Response regulator transcription factor n=1 Tax=Magnetospirillum sulfuroxidans TaxID=611300 RepID=A0ABS5IBD5_9PROT|nr:response regulator transcription factor [Magnetospirillum sulfuroxidans]MBR9971063.1 response regulator transcription factor [Magnetospirillum sulfuroxidans]